MYNIPVNPQYPTSVDYRLEKEYEGRLIDEISIEKIVFKDTNMTLEQFIENVSSYGHIRIYVGKDGEYDRTEFYYSFEFLIRLNPIRQVDNSIIITIPDYLSTRFNMIKLTNAEIDLKFMRDHQFTNINIVAKLTFYDRPTRNMLMQSNGYGLTQYVYHVDEICADTLEKKIRSCSNQLAKGFFVIGDIDNQWHG
jgi:hypothetical protein